MSEDTMDKEINSNCEACGRSLLNEEGVLETAMTFMASPDSKYYEEFLAKHKKDTVHICMMCVCENLCGPSKAGQTNEQEGAES